MFQTSKMGSPQLEATFDTIIEVFLFLDKNGDGKLNKKDMVRALNDSNTSERSPAHITRSRFSNCLLYFSFCFPLVIFLRTRTYSYLSNLISCRRNGLGQKWACQFQGVPLCFHSLGWNRNRRRNARYKKLS